MERVKENLCASPVWLSLLKVNCQEQCNMISEQSVTPSLCASNTCNNSVKSTLRKSEMNTDKS